MSLLNSWILQIVDLQKPGTTHSELLVLRDLAIALSACIYQSLCDSDTFKSSLQEDQVGELLPQGFASPDINFGLFYRKVTCRIWLAAEGGRRSVSVSRLRLCPRSGREWRVCARCWLEKRTRTHPGWLLCCARRSRPLIWLCCCTDCARWIVLYFSTSQATASLRILGDSEYCNATVFFLP